MDTIFALASGSGRAGIAVIRVSGPAAGEVYEVLSGSGVPKPRFATRVELRNPEQGDLLDDALALWFPAPHSYTGDDVLELHIHGGAAVFKAVSDSISATKGVRPAEPGEFTRRAFLSGKMDLTEAEGLIDLIDAETEVQRRQALRLASGQFGVLCQNWRHSLTEVLAHTEAYLDFPDEDLPESASVELERNILRLEAEILQHLDDKHRGERIRTGVRAVIVGPPNAGKSSLLNLLAQREAAIVSHTAGTTRDVIEVHLDLGGYPVTVVDTAGLRDVNDEVEKEGIRRAMAAAALADLQLVVLDMSDIQQLDALGLSFSAETMVLFNKSDLSDVDGTELPLDEYPDDTMVVSVKSGEGIDAFLSLLTSKIEKLFVGSETAMITRARHRKALTEVREALYRSRQAVLPELQAEDLRVAYRALGRITGTVDVEDLLDVIFRDFCIGK